MRYVRVTSQSIGCERRLIKFRKPRDEEDAYLLIGKLPEDVKRALLSLGLVDAG